jgi:hypothetical protein
MPFGQTSNCYPFREADGCVYHCRSITMVDTRHLICLSSSIGVNRYLSAVTTALFLATDRCGWTRMVNSISDQHRDTILVSRMPFGQTLPRSGMDVGTIASQWWTRRYLHLPPAFICVNLYPSAANTLQLFLASRSFPSPCSSGLDPSSCPFVSSSLHPTPDTQHAASFFASVFLMRSTMIPIIANAGR